MLTTKSNRYTFQKSGIWYKNTSYGLNFLKVSNQIFSFCLISFFVCNLLIPNVLHAAKCVDKYDKSALPYPSRQMLCPNGTRFTDYLTGKSHPCEVGHVDHVIPTKMMYNLGICGDRLAKFSNDRANLRMLHSRLNLEKSDKNPLLYSMRHGPMAEKNMNDIIKNMSTKYPEISIKKLKADAFEKLPKELAMLNRQKNKALSFARKQAEPTRKLKRKIQNRLLKALARNTSFTVYETSTLIVAPLALGAIFLDLRDTCETLKDLKDIGKVNNIEEDQLPSENYEGICGMSNGEFLKFIGIDLKAQRCIEAMQERNEATPPGCEGMEINFPKYVMEKNETKEKIKLPNYSGTDK